MLTIHPQYIHDTTGKKSMVILPVDEFDKLIDELEELEDIRLYDEVKQNDTGERISMNDAFKMIEEKRKIKSK